MKRKLLAIGHSLILAQNRDVFRVLHKTEDVEVTIMAPRFFHGDLRDIHIEDEPADSTMKVIPIDCYWTSRIHFFCYNIWQIQKYLDDEKYDVVYLWEEPYIVSGFTVSHMLYKRNLPYVLFSGQNLLKNYPWPFSLFERLTFKRALASYGCGVGVLEMLNSRNAPRAEILPLFVSLERFKPFSEEKKQLGLARLGLQSAHITIGFMGRLVEEKGIPVFCQVMDRVLEKSEVNIVVVGAGPLKENLEKWKDGKKNIVLLEAKHHEVPNILPLMDMILCPSQTRKHWKEQFGRMLVEAFACGTAVIGSDSGEIPHVIGDAGLIVGESDIEGWVAATEELKNNHHHRAKLVQKGFERTQKYSADTIAGQLWASLSKHLHWT